MSPADRTPELADLFASIARQLQAAGSLEKVQHLITTAAVETVGGCHHAAISLLTQHGGLITVAATDDVPPRVDALQYQLGEGPCVDTIGDHEVYLVDDLATECRWPRFGPKAAADTGVASMLAFRLFVEQGSLGALNFYSRDRGAFDDDARHIGAILAAHAAIAMSAAQDRHNTENLERALQSNRTIGMALGIVMGRRHVTEDTAFDLLRRTSQHLNTKLRDLAERVVETGELPESGARRH